MKAHVVLRDFIGDETLGANHDRKQLLAARVIGISKDPELTELQTNHLRELVETLGSSEDKTHEMFLVNSSCISQWVNSLA